VLAAATIEVGGIGALAAPIAAMAVVELIREAVGEIGIQFVDLESTSEAVATISNEQGSPFKGDVTAVGPGIAGIKGKLDLKDFGSAEDAVPVLVLPALTEAVLDPVDILLCRFDSPYPGRPLRTIAAARFASDVTITPSDLGLTDATVQEVAGMLLPLVLPANGLPFDELFGDDTFKFGFRGTITVNGSSIVWNNPEFRFYVPNVSIPSLGIQTNDYNFIDYVEEPIAGIDPSNIGAFAVRVLHYGEVGWTRVNNFVNIPGLGSVQAQGSVLVTEACSTPFVVKESENQSGIISTTAGSTYTVMVGNPQTYPLENVTVRDLAVFTPAVAAGDPAQDAVEIDQLIPIGTVAPRSSVTVTFNLPPFFQAGTIWNSASLIGPPAPVPGRRPCEVNPNRPDCDDDIIVIEDEDEEPPIEKPDPCVIDPPKCSPPSIVVPGSGPVIYEMALQPLRDWNDSSGGNGTPFDAIPGTGVVDGNDVWVEISNGTTGTEDWVVQLQDATGATFQRPLGPPTVFRQTRLLSGFGTGTSPIVRVQVIDNLGVVRQDYDIVAIEAALGPATGIDNETLSYSIFGSPTLPTQQLLRRAATINRFWPF
jgi:hypothetical protein